MDRSGIYGGDPLSVGEVERLCTGLALDEDQRAADRLKALALLHDWAEARRDGTNAEGCTIRVALLDDAADL